MTGRIGHKRILGGLIVIVLAVACTAQVGLRTIPAGVVGAHGSILTPSDLTLVGAFDLPLPPIVDGIQSSARTNGFNIRYVDGVRHFLVQQYNYLVEVEDPGTATSTPYPVATYPEWGGNYLNYIRTQAFLPNDNGDFPGGHTSVGLSYNGIYWDDVLQRGYFNYYDPYGRRDADYSFAAFTINDTTHTTNNIGCWGINQNQQLGNTGILAIPNWFTSAYLAAGQRLGLGLGNPDQSALNGNIGSDGPTVTAFAPDTGTNGCPSKPAFLAGQTLLKFGDATRPGPYGTPSPARTTLLNYSDQFTKWNPRNGIGYFTRQSIGGQACTWVDTPARSGLVCLWLMGNGSFEAVVQASPPPTLTATGGSMTLNTTTLADGSSLRSGDVLVVQVAGTGGLTAQNCGGTCEVYVSSVSGNTVSFRDTGAHYCASDIGPGPNIGGIVFGYGAMYCNATIQHLRGRHRFYIYDPADLAAVAQGTKTADQPDAVSQWEPSLDSPWFTEPTPGHAGSGDYFKTTGIAFDPIKKQLLVAIDHAGAASGCQGFECAPRVYVYSVP